MTDIKLIVCDMAGTTVQDNHEVEACFSKAARETGLKMTPDEILSVQGWAKRNVFEIFWERQIGKHSPEYEHSVEHSFQQFKTILENYYRDNKVLPTKGFAALAEFLRANNIALALTTGFYRKVIDIILAKLNWQLGPANLSTGGPIMIQASIASDEVKKGRPAPDMIMKAMSTLGITNVEEVINIGDTPSDIRSGHLAGCRYSTCVINGTHNREQLETSRPDKMFLDLDDFRLWLEGQL